MANGKPGDHPYTDIVVHGADVYGALCDGLVREIARLGGQTEVSDMLYERFHPTRAPDLEALALALAALRDRLLAEAKERGQEM